VLYAGWLRVFEDKKTAQGVGYTHFEFSGPEQVTRFVATGVRAAFHGMGQVPVAGWMLGAVLVIGFALAWSRLDWSDRRNQLAMPGALLLGAFLSLSITGIARAAAFGAQFARTGRYLYLFTALALPAIAVAANALARRWRILMPVVLVLFLVGIPGNVNALLQQRRSERSFQAEYRRLILTLPRVPLARQVPRSTRPEQRLAKPLTLGWLLDGVASGSIPKPTDIKPVDAATASLHLALNQQPDAFGTKACRNATTPLELELLATQSIGLHGVVRVVYTTSAGVRSRPVTFKPDEAVVLEGGRVLSGPRLVAQAGPLALEIESATGDPVALCR
jgi:hypothetical protein